MHNLQSGQIDAPNEATKLFHDHPGSSAPPGANLTIREKREPFKLESEAVYDGEWLG